VKAVDMYVPLATKYGSRVLLATKPIQLFFWFALLLDKDIRSYTLLSSEATFGFCLHC